MIGNHARRCTNASADHSWIKRNIKPSRANASHDRTDQHAANNELQSFDLLLAFGLVFYATIFHALTCLVINPDGLRSLPARFFLYFRSN